MLIAAPDFVYIKDGVQGAVDFSHRSVLRYVRIEKATATP
jgi:hypothetical protein